jgi:hypothetical protein
VLEAWLDPATSSATTPGPIPISRTLCRRTEDVAKGAALLDSPSGPGRRLVWFRHPFLHAGDTPAKKQGLASYLEENGWRVAPVTVYNQEWVYAYVYHAALERGDSALSRRVGEAYLDHIDGAFAYFEERSR